ncbi:MAG: hypothetical protein ABJQ34_15175 [Paracoccaceae bacterium]
MKTRSARNQIVQKFVAAFAKDGPKPFIDNLETQVSEHRWGKHLVPMTINDGISGSAFTCSLRVAYIEYTKEELARFPNRFLVPFLHLLVNTVGLMLLRSNVDRIVHINNWMMSTNLPVDLDPSLTSTQTHEMTRAFPQHLLAIRSLTRQHSDKLMKALENEGWIMLPSRQVFLAQNVAKDSLSRRDARNDEKLWQLGAFDYDELSEMTDADAQRIADLYELLYLDKYSRINPVYTPQFIKLTHSIGMIRYLVLRDKGGQIQGFGGMHQNGRHGTMPLIGYNTQLDRSLGLYRLVCHAGSRYAARHELEFNMSSGAAQYKMTRGAAAEMEFTAFYIRHLPPLRRAPFAVLRLIGNKVAIPLLKRYQL